MIVLVHPTMNCMLLHFVGKYLKSLTSKYNESALTYLLISALFLFAALYIVSDVPTVLDNAVAGGFAFSLLLMCFLLSLFLNILVSLSNADVLLLNGMIWWCFCWDGGVYYPITVQIFNWSN